MQYAGMPMGMWVVFSKSFRRNLTEVLKYDAQESKRITASAKKKYREIIEKLPEFEKADRFKMNIVNCAMLSAFFLNMPKLPSVDDATEYYKSTTKAKPGSLASKAQMVQQYNDKHAKKK